MRTRGRGEEGEEEAKREPRDKVIIAKTLNIFSLGSETSKFFERHFFGRTSNRTVCQQTCKEGIIAGNIVKQTMRIGRIEGNKSAMQKAFENI